MNRSMQMPERELERALGALLKVDAAAGRLSRDPWDAVAPRLGSQRSRRPWEYVMEALNKPRLPFKPQYIYTAGAALVVVIAVLLLVILLNTDDGSNSESVPASAPESQIIVDEPAGAAAVAVDPSVNVEPGSDAAELVALWERQVAAVHRWDFEAYAQGCSPGVFDTPDQAEHTFTFTASGIDASSAGRFNVRITDIRLYGGDTAIVTMDWLDGDRIMWSGLGQFHEKTDGRWFQQGFGCTTQMNG